MSNELYNFEILTSFAQVQEIAASWQTLHAHAGKDGFGNFEDFKIWWKHFGQKANIRLHIVIARTPLGELRALLPLVIRRRYFLRVLEWAGGDFFDYEDVLAENESDAEALWRFVCASGGFDIASIKDIRCKALSLQPLTALMHLREQHKNYYLKIDFSSDNDWLATKSRGFRKEIRRHIKKLSEHGAVSFHVYQNGAEFPDAVIHALYEQKKAWFATQYSKGAYLLPEMESFFLALSREAARNGTLYLAWLSCDEAIVSVNFGFIYSDVLHLYITTYDDAYAVCSPGNLMLIETVRNAIGSGLHETDFMRGDEEYKKRFSSGYRMLANFIVGHSVIGKIIAWLYLSGTRGAALFLTLLPTPSKKEAAEEQPKPETCR